MQINKAIGRLVTIKRRAVLGITQEELASRSKISRSHLSDIERGLVCISLETLEKICSGLTVPMVDFITELYNEDRTS